MSTYMHTLATLYLMASCGLETCAHSCSTYLGRQYRHVFCAKVAQHLQELHCEIKAS